MHTKTTSVLCLLFCVQAFAVRNLQRTESRSLLQHDTSLAIGSAAASTRGTSSGAQATVNLSLNGPGKVTALAQSKGIGVTKVKDAFVEAILEAVAEVQNGGDAMAIASIEATAYGTAIAEALAEARVELSSNAIGGAACASASSNARATASAFASVLVNVLAEASNKVEFATASAAVEAVADVTVEAFAEAEARACGRGVFFARTGTTILARAIGTAYAKVIAMALAMVAPGASAAEIDVQAVNDVLQVSTIDGKTATEVFGNADASTSGSAGTAIFP